MSEHPGLLGFISEAAEIREQLGVSVDESFRMQQERNAERQALQHKAVIESNVIPFRPRHRR